MWRLGVALGVSAASRLSMIDWNSFPDELEQSVLSLRTLPKAPAQRLRSVAAGASTHGVRRVAVIGPAPIHQMR